MELGSLTRLTAKIASTSEISDKMRRITAVTCLGFSTLSYMFPRKMKPMPPLMQTLYLKSLQNATLLVATPLGAGVNDTDLLLSS